MTRHKVKPIGTCKHNCFKTICRRDYFIRDMLDSTEYVAMFSFDCFNQFFFTGGRLVESLDSAISSFELFDVLLENE